MVVLETQSRGSPVSGGFILWRPWTSVLKFHVNPSNSCWDIQSRGAAPAETEPCEHLLPPLTMCNRAQHEPSWQWWTALYAIPSEAHEAVSIHKRRTPPAYWFSSADVRPVSCITRWFWFEPNRARRHQTQQECDWYTQKETCRPTHRGRPRVIYLSGRRDCELYLSSGCDKWKGSGWLEAILNQLN